MLLAMREEELDASHPLLTLVRRLETDRRRSSDPLGSSAAGRKRWSFSSQQADGRDSLDRGLADRILGIAGGNPLFVLAYRDAIGSDGEELPRRPEGGSRGPHRRSRRCHPAGASAASVVGSDFDPEVLRTVAGRSEEEVVTAVETMVRRRLFKENAAPG